MKGKNVLVKDDVSRNNDLAGRRVETTKPFVMRGVAEKDAREGPRREFVRRRSRDIRIAKTPENAEDRVIWRSTTESLVRSKIGKTRCGKKIDDEGGNGERFGPISRRKRGLEEERTDHISQGTDHAFGVTVLLRCIRAREARKNAGLREERGESFILKFTSVITLKGFDGDAELGAHKSAKIDKGLRNFRLMAKGEGPGEVREIIK